MADDFVFGEDAALDGEILPPKARNAAEDKKLRAARLITLADEVGDRARENWDAIRDLYEHTKMPLPLVAEQYNVSVAEVKEYAEREKWYNPRKKAEETGPVIDQELDENGDPVKRLTDQQRLAVEEYLKDPTFNKTAAAKRAGYSNAAVFNNELVQQAVGTAIAERAERNKMAADDVLIELERLAKANMADYVEWDAQGNVRFKPSDQLTEDQKAGIISISQGRNGTKIELAKVAAIKMLGTHMGMFVERSENLTLAQIRISQDDAEL